MNLSPRERVIAITLAAVLGLWVLNYFLIDPYFAKTKELDEQIAAKENEQYEAYKLRKQYKESRDVWKNLLAAGLKSDVPTAESQLGHALQKWMSDAKVKFSSSKPERATTHKDFYQLNSRISGGGSQAEVVKLLWQVETSQVPVRITEMQLTSKKEGAGDELQLQLGVSSLCENLDAGKTDPARRGSAPTERSRS